MNRKARKAERRHGYTGQQWMAMVRTLPCAVTTVTEELNRKLMSRCYGAMQAHHSTGAGMGMKSSDFETMSLCAKHHLEFHAAAGPFRSMSKSDKRQWQDNAIEETRVVLLGQRLPRCEVPR